MTMRRLLALAAFFLIFSFIPVCAQRGGHAVGGSHGGFSGSHGGFAGHTGIAGHSGGTGGFGGSHFMGGHVGSHIGPGNGFRGTRFRGRGFDRGFHRRCFGCGFGNYGYGYPYYSYYYDPYWWWDTYSSYDEDYERDRQIAAEMNAENLEEQRALREQDSDRYYERRSSQRPASPARDEYAENDPPTVLIFRDQHQREIHNYAIADGILWNFTPQRSEKIPLAILDIPATRKANDDRGVEFHLPIPGAGQ